MRVLCASPKVGKQNITSSPPQFSKKTGAHPRRALLHVARVGQAKHPRTSERPRSGRKLADLLTRWLADLLPTRPNLLS
jgi:hypothetical protein